MYLVIGSTGFIGRHLVKQLAAKYPGQVRALVRKNSSRSALAAIAGVEIVEGDVVDFAALQRALQDVQVIYYLAAVTANIKNKDNIYWKVNVEGARNAVKAAEEAGVQRFVMVSGLGTVEGKPGSYMRTRWEMQQALRNSQLNWVIIQPSILFGEGAEFFEAQARIMKLLPVAAVIGGGQTRFQPIYVEDVARATIQAGENNDKAGQLIELGGPQYYTYTELVKMILKAINKKRIRMPLPLWAARLNAAMMSILPRPPLTPATLELFDFDNVTPDPQIVEHNFGFKPASLQDYLDQHGIKV